MTRDPFDLLDPEEVEKNVDIFYRNSTKAVKQFTKLELDARKQIAEEIQGEVKQFQPKVPLVMGLRNPGMRQRHWDALSEAVGFKVVADEHFTLQKAIKMGLVEHASQVEKIGDTAGKEFQLEVALDKMETEWRTIDMEPVGFLQSPCSD